MPDATTLNMPGSEVALVGVPEPVANSGGQALAQLPIHAALVAVSGVKKYSVLPEEASVRMVTDWPFTVAVVVITRAAVVVGVVAAGVGVVAAGVGVLPLPELVELPQAASTIVNRTSMVIGKVRLR